MMVNSNPPLLHHYGALLGRPPAAVEKPESARDTGVMEECQLPLIDLAPLFQKGGGSNSEGWGRCAGEIARAAAEWGFFQVVNHGVGAELLEKMRREQERLFGAPFETKVANGLLKNCYRWGTPTAMCPDQFSWSEAFHIPVAQISAGGECCEEFGSLRDTMGEFTGAMSVLARSLAGVLARTVGSEKEAAALNNKKEEMMMKWDSSGSSAGAGAGACFLRLNRYPACAVSGGEIFGLVPHTDSGLLTIVSQDEVGGLQLKKDSKWVAVKPNKDALIVNVGDMFQAWSNDVYKSVEHKVMVNEKVERYSIAYFLCPSNESVIGSCKEPSIYRKFTFGEYREKVQEDVKRSGYKVGLTRFLL